MVAGVKHAIDRKALIVQSKSMQLFRRARRFGYRAFVRPRCQDHCGLARIVQGVKCGLEACLLHL
jgi:cell division septation protein DedD